MSKFLLVVMLINAWGPSWHSHEFPDRESCERALSTMKAPINPQADMKGNYSYVYCVPAPARERSK